MAGRVYVIIVNWNGWRDTIACLESLFRSDCEELTVVVCDNASNDGSLDLIKKWAAGQLDIQYDTSLSGGGGARRISRALSFLDVAPDSPHLEATGVQLVLIQTGGNLGFAGGNNVGIRFALSQADCEYLWLLNNDTVVAPDALSHLVARMKEDQNIGVCGSTILEYHKPEIVQALAGATYSRWTG